MITTCQTGFEEFQSSRWGGSWRLIIPEKRLCAPTLKPGETTVADVGLQS